MKDKSNSSKCLDSMEVNLPGDQLPPKPQFKQPRSILKAPRGAKRKVQVP